MNKENIYPIHQLSKVLFLGIGISKIFIIAKTDCLISMIIGSIIGLIIMYLINITNKKNNKLNKIICFINTYLLLLIILADFVNLITSIYLINTNKFIIIIPLLIIIIYLNKQSLNISIKISKCINYICLIIFFIIVLALIPYIKPLNYLPIFNVSIKNILKASILYSLYSTTPNILFNYLNINVNSKTMLKEYLKSNLFLILIFMTTQGVLGINLIKLFKYPEYIVLKKINILDFINNIENIASFIWIFIIFSHLNLCSKVLYDMTNNIFKNKYIYPIFLLISIYFITLYIFNNESIILLLYKYLEYICIFILTLFFIPKIKK